MWGQANPVWDGRNAWDHVRHKLHTSDDTLYHTFVTHIDIQDLNEDVTALPPLPDTLEYLICQRCPSLCTLPSMAPWLLHLKFTDCGALRALPPLPLTLLTLACHNCTALEQLPALEALSLTHLDVRACAALRALGSLPGSLTYLNCTRCASLARLPLLMRSSLRTLRCGRTPIRQLPDLPSTLALLDASSCAQLRHLPPLPA